MKKFAAHCAIFLLFFIPLISKSQTVWHSEDIGSVAAAGSTTIENGKLIIRGSGEDIWGTADEFHYFYKNLSGDIDAVIKVDSLELVDNSTKVGIMIRESNAANSKHVTIFSHAGALFGIGLQRRTSTGGNSEATNVAGYVPPGFLRLVRSGNTFTSYVSLDSAEWIQLGDPVTMSMSTALVGIAITSNIDGSVARAVISGTNLLDLNSTPEAPTNLAGTILSSGEISLSWTDNSYNEEGFILERKENSGAFVYLDSLEANITTFSDATVAPGNTYSFRITAFNSNGNSQYNEIADIYVPSNPYVDTAFYEVEDHYSVINDVGSNGTVGIQYSSVTSNGEAIRLFDLGDILSVSFPVPASGDFKLRVRVRSGGGGGPTNFWPNGYLFSIGGTEVVSFVGDVSTVEGPFSAYGTSYWGIMEATVNFASAGTKELYIEANSNWQAVDYLEVISVQPTIPLAPTELSALLQSDEQIDLTWTDNSDNEEGFVLERKTGVGSYEYLDSLAANSVTYSDTSVSSGFAYTYRLMAYNENGVSLYVESEEVQLPAVAQGDTTRYEIEEHYTVVNDVGSNGNVGIQYGNAVRLFDLGDALSVSFSIPSPGEYQLRVWVRSGGSSPTNFWPDGYLFSLGGTEPITFTGNASTVEGPFNTYGTSHWGFMEAMINFTTSGSKELHIEANSYWLAVDYLEVISMGASPTTPEAPTSLTAAVTPENNIQLTWTDNSDNEEGFVLERKLNSGSYTYLDSLVANDTVYTDVTANAGNTYTYRLATFNSAGSSSYISRYSSVFSPDSTGYLQFGRQLLLYRKQQHIYFFTCRGRHAQI